jgi:hypothetical protein
MWPGCLMSEVAGLSLTVTLCAKLSRSKWSFSLPPISTFPKRSLSAPHYFVYGSGAFFLWRFSPLQLWSRFVAPIPTAEMECVLRPRDRQAKSSSQTHCILIQLF